MRLVSCAAVLAAALSLAPAASAQVDPPYSGTIFLDPDIVVPSDPTVFESATFSGRGLRTVFDRRANAFIQIDAYLVDLAFTDGTTIEAQINPEFGSASAAMTEAETYGRYVGQLARALRRDIDALWIHQGVEPFGGGNRSILIHTGQSDLYVSSGILEETLIHEAAHTSLDADHAQSAGWLSAQDADPTFISTYARDFPLREDIAESILPYLAVTYRRDRVSQEYIDTVTGAIPNRIAYFDAQTFDLSPFQASVAIAPPPPRGAVSLSVSPNPVAASASFTLRLALHDARHVRVDVVDVRGRKVAQIASRSFPAGETALTWFAGTLSPGTYVVRATAGDEVWTEAVTVGP
ncbi:MAG: hypothetical protein AAF791_07970 [Bacteroidota bacterium]